MWILESEAVSVNNSDACSRNCGFVVTQDAINQFIVTCQPRLSEFLSICRTINAVPTQNLEVEETDPGEILSPEMGVPTLRKNSRVEVKERTRERMRNLDVETVRMEGLLRPDGSGAKTLQVLGRNC